MKKITTHPNLTTKTFISNRKKDVCLHIFGYNNTFDHIPSAPTKRSPSHRCPFSSTTVTYAHKQHTFKRMKHHDQGMANRLYKTRLSNAIPVKYSMRNRWASTNQQLHYLISIIFKVNNIAVIQNNIIPNCTSKDLLQSHSADYSSDWKPPFHCRSESIKLDVPDDREALRWLDANN